MDFLNKIANKLYLIIHKVSQLLNALIGMPVILTIVIALLLAGTVIWLLTGSHFLLLIAIVIGQLVYFSIELLYSFNVHDTPETKRE